MVRAVAIIESRLKNREKDSSILDAEVMSGNTLTLMEVLEDIIGDHLIKNKDYASLQKMHELVSWETGEISIGQVITRVSKAPFTEAVPPLKAGALDSIESQPLSKLEFKDLAAWGIHKVDTGLLKYLVRTDPEVTVINVSSPAGESHALFFEIPPEYYALKTIELISTNDELLYDLNYFNTVTTKVKGQEVLILASLRDFDSSEISTLLKTLSENTPFAEIPHSKEVAEWITNLDPDEYKDDFIQAAIAITEKGIVYGFIPEEYSEAPTSESIVAPKLANKIINVTRTLKKMELPYSIMPSLDGRFYIRLWTINIVISPEEITVNYSENRDRCLAEKMKQIFSS